MILRALACIKIVNTIEKEVEGGPGLIETLPRGETHTPATPLNPRPCARTLSPTMITI